MADAAPLNDLGRAAAVLAHDRAWGAYLLADLEPPLAAHARWFVSHDAPAVVLLYDAFGMPLVTPLGPAEACAPLFEAALAAMRAGEGPTRGSGCVFVACAPEHRAFVDRLAPLEAPLAMWRMRLEAARFDSAARRTAARVAPLAVSDLAALRTLYDDGEAAGEAPDFFLPAMLDDGTYMGAWEDGALTAAAGTHVVARSARVAAIGNVYVRRDRRERGLGGAVTAAVARTLFARGVDLAVLNVRQDRPAAIRVYERLGFVAHGPFFEGWGRLA